MRRSEFLACSGVTVDTYKNLRNRNQLPINGGDVKDEGRHTHFSTIDCLKMKMMAVLGEGIGPQASGAQWLSFWFWNRITQSGLDDIRGLAAADILGVYHLDEGQPVTRIGNRSDLLLALQHETAARVIILDISGAARAVLEKARALGVEDDALDKLEARRRAENVSNLPGEVGQKGA